MCNSRNACTDYLLYTRRCGFRIEYDIVPTLKELTVQGNDSHVNKFTVIGTIIQICMM